MTRYTFTLRFPVDKIRTWESRGKYETDEKENRILTEIAPRVRNLGYFQRDDFLFICEWKSARPCKHFQKNSDGYIREVTQTALSTTNERLRIEILTLLDGVKWPTASVLLHFAYDNLYPILDFRALWSLGYDKPPVYDFNFWRAYTQYCYETAKASKVSMRTLDRALWQYSDEHQPKTKS